MKFKTIVITKKTIIVCLAALVSVAAAACVCFTARRTEDVFGEQSGAYEDILKEGLPSDEGIELKSALNKIIGFDIDKPETIIDEYSTVFNGTTADVGDNAEVETPDAEPKASEETAAPNETASEEPPLPDSAAIASASGLEVSNATDYSVNADAACTEPMSFGADTNEPLVLIMHTHTTECYDGDAMSGETERNTNEELNVIAVGNEICSVLEENGIKTIHDATYHDYPSYQGAYTRALATIENQLREYPSIKAVLDIHRDAFIYPDGTKLRVARDINGKSTAQVMIVAGTDSMGLWHDNWRENFKFAAKIQNAAQIMYPGLMRPINLRTERFNEHTTTGSLILEVGSNGNTLEEAKEGARCVARAVAAVLKAK